MKRIFYDLSLIVIFVTIIITAIGGYVVNSKLVKSNKSKYIRKETILKYVPKPEMKESCEDKENEEKSKCNRPHETHGRDGIDGYWIPKGSSGETAPQRPKK